MSEGKENTDWTLTAGLKSGFRRIFTKYSLLIKSIALKNFFLAVRGFCFYLSSFIRICITCSIKLFNKNSSCSCLELHLPGSLDCGGEGDTCEGRGAPQSLASPGTHPAQSLAIPKLHTFVGRWLSSPRLVPGFNVML